MNEYHSRGKEVIKIFINNGFEAYFVGETVRNLLLEKPLKNMEITTSAHLDVVKRMFKDYLITEIDENTISLEYAGYFYNIQSFITTEGVNKNIPLNKHYSKNLLDDLANRDFTINALAMSHSGKLTDAHDGYNDIKRKLITHIGNAKTRFFKNPNIMIRAFALISELNYKLSSKTKKAIYKRKKNLLNCNVSEYILDFKKIIEGEYPKKAIKMMCKLNVQKTIVPFKKTIKLLKSRFKKCSFEEVLLMSDVLNGKLNNDFIPYIDNYDEYVRTYELVCLNKKSKYDALTLYNYGLATCLKANRINYLLSRPSKKDKNITKQWDKLSIKNIDELNYSEEDLKKIIRERDYEKINSILEEVLKLVLLGELKNNKNDIERIIIQILQKQSIFYNLNGVTSFDDGANIYSEEFITEKNTEINVVQNEEIETIIQEVIEKEKIDINETKVISDPEVYYYVNMFINDCMDYLKTNDELKKIIFNNEDFKKQLYNFVLDYIKKGQE